MPLLIVVHERTPLGLEEPEPFDVRLLMFHLFVGSIKQSGFAAQEREKLPLGTSSPLQVIAI